MKRLNNRGRRIYRAMRKHYLGMPRAQMLLAGRTWNGKQLEVECGTACHCLYVARMQQNHSTPIGEIVANY